MEGIERKTQVVLDRVGYRGRYFLWYRLKQTITNGIDSLKNERYPVSILLTEANFPRAPLPCSPGQDTQPTHTHIVKVAEYNTLFTDVVEKKEIPK